MQSVLSPELIFARASVITQLFISILVIEWCSTRYNPSVQCLAGDNNTKIRMEASASATNMRGAALSRPTILLANIALAAGANVPAVHAAPPPCAWPVVVTSLGRTHASILEEITSIPLRGLKHAILHVVTKLSTIKGQTSKQQAHKRQSNISMFMLATRTQLRNFIFFSFIQQQAINNLTVWNNN